jgi:hypothetical protein
MNRACLAAVAVAGAVISMGLGGCSATSTPPPPTPQPSPVTSIGMPPPDEQGPDVTITGDVSAVPGHPGCVVLHLSTQTWRLTGPLADALIDPAAAVSTTRRLTVRGHAARASGTTTVCGPFPAFVVTDLTEIHTTETT